MKKIWKNLCACSLAVACGAGMTACGKEKSAVSVDLDGDGVVSSWETLFDASSNAQLKDVTPGEFVYITDAAGLLDINNKTKNEPAKPYTYILKNNIDLGGQAVCINLGVSELYGYNRTISNFKLGTIATTTENGIEVGAGDVTKCLFYGGVRVSGVKLFMGVQSLSVDALAENYSISPFYNVPAISQVSVKGKINISGVAKQGRAIANVEASLLYSGRDETIVDGENTVFKEASTAIKEVGVDGVINLTDQNGSWMVANIGGVAGTLGRKSSIYDVFSSVEITATPSQSIACGEVVGRNYGFVSTAISTGDINMSSMDVTERQYVGGIAGYNGSLAELKNCSTNTKITYNSATLITPVFRDSQDYFYGGIVGFNDGGVVDSAQSDAQIIANNLYRITAGGICGVSNNGIVSYALCRGSITCTNVLLAQMAHTCGYSANGLIEKIIATTTLNLNNATTDSSIAFIGMLTIFESEDAILDRSMIVGEDSYLRSDYNTCPKMRNVLVTGDTEVNVKSLIGGNAVYHKLGMRNLFKVTEVAEEGEDDIVVDMLPDVFKDIYYSPNGAKFKVYEYGEDGKIENSPKLKYNAKITTSETHFNNLIDRIGFKNYLNHNEVNLSVDLNLNALHFTLDKTVQEQSYFGGSEYNGELAYFDRYFENSVVHKDIDGCEYDSQDELMSFLYDFITTAPDGDCIALKFNKSFLGIDWSMYEEGEYPIEGGLSLNSNKLFNALNSALNCMNVYPEYRVLDINKQPVLESSKMAKYIEFAFSYNGEKYILTFDVYSMENYEGNDIANRYNFIVYASITII
ncbi:MAG: hypothetical protein IJW59_01325 [Clostridia bacterium]|nr:hypothetical protein [Clostridia bacterium]